jgi:hypothetical protein
MVIEKDNIKGNFMTISPEKFKRTGIELKKIFRDQYLNSLLLIHCPIGKNELIQARC